MVTILLIHTMRLWRIQYGIYTLMRLNALAVSTMIERDDQIPALAILVAEHQRARHIVSDALHTSK